MTTKQFIMMIGEAETGGLSPLKERLAAIGDHGLAGGYYQQHWAWRRDYWPAAAWEALRMYDAMAISLYVEKHRNMTARELAGMYNLGHAAPDPGYDERCTAGLSRLGIDLDELDKPVEDI